MAAIWQITISCAFLLWKSLCFGLKFHWKFLPKGPINDKPALIQIMACRLFGDKPLSEAMLARFTDAYMHHLALMSWALNKHLLSPTGDDIFHYIFMTENNYSLIQISLNAISRISHSVLLKAMYHQRDFMYKDSLVLYTVCDTLPLPSLTQVPYI